MTKVRNIINFALLIFKEEIMTRNIFISVLMFLIFLPCAIAQQEDVKEKIVTNKWSFMAGSMVFVNHYMTDQEYTGTSIGVMGEHGSFYKKSENLSWDYDMAFFTAPYFRLVPDLSLSNPAKTTFVASHNLNTSYGTHYNWAITDRLLLKAGGRFDILAAINNGRPNSINNAISVDFQTQLEASAGIRYGFSFDKFGVSLFGDLALPFIGFMLVNSKYQDILSTGQLLPGDIRHMVFSSFHNLQGYELEIGADLTFRNVTLSLSSEGMKRWWTAYELQNYRKFSFFKIGVSVDLISRSRLNSGNRYF